MIETWTIELGSCVLSLLGRRRRRRSFALPVPEHFFKSRACLSVFSSGLWVGVVWCGVQFLQKIKKIVAGLDFFSLRMKARVESGVAGQAQAEYM